MISWTFFRCGSRTFPDVLRCSVNHWFQWGRPNIPGTQRVAAATASRTRRIWCGWEQRRATRRRRQKRIKNQRTTPKNKTLDKSTNQFTPNGLLGYSWDYLENFSSSTFQVTLSGNRPLLGRPVGRRMVTWVTSPPKHGFSWVWKHLARAQPPNQLVICSWFSKEKLIIPQILYEKSTKKHILLVPSVVHSWNFDMWYGYERLPDIFFRHVIGI